MSNVRILRATQKARTDYESAWERIENYLDTTRIKDKKTFKDELRRATGKRYNESLADQLINQVREVQTLIGDYPRTKPPAQFRIQLISVRGKKRQIYRDARGRFAKKPS